MNHYHTNTHNHGITDKGHSHSLTMYGQTTNNTSAGNERLLRGSGYSTYSGLGVANGNTTGITINNYTGNTGTYNGSTSDTGDATETRSNNFTYKIWIRTA